MKWAARPLRPTEFPYYLSRPRESAERAPGWYMRLPGLDHAVYLGANHVDAEIELLRMVEVAKKAEFAPGANTPQEETSSA